MTETIKPRRIVVGIDGSSSSLDALRWAVAQAKLTGDDVQAVIAWDYPALYGGAVMPDVDWQANAQSTIDEALASALGDDSTAVSATVVRGYPPRVLVEAAAGADLLVVGNRGHSEFAEILLGSVSQHVVTHATCPVVVVRPSDG